MTEKTHTYQKRYSTPEDNEAATVGQQEGHFHNIIKSQTCWWATRVWKTITSQMFSHRSEGFEPTAGSSVFGVCHWGEEPPEF